MTFDPEDMDTEVIAETKDYSVWVAEEPDGETTWHVELGAVTVHFFAEEWEEVRELFRMVEAAANKTN